jgi:hypothetical protein
MTPRDHMTLTSRLLGALLVRSLVLAAGVSLIILLIVSLL